MVIVLFFFFSSRRRHTRSLRDWSSDVCSSDLPSRDCPRRASRVPWTCCRSSSSGWRTSRSASSVRWGYHRSGFPQRAHHPEMLKTADASVQAAARALRAARSLVVTTGAGMSSDSGVPTFRDALTGLWARYDPEELATEAAFRRNPARVFGWYVWRGRLVRAAVPHAGYHALVARSEEHTSELQSR